MVFTVVVNCEMAVSETFQFPENQFPKEALPEGHPDILAGWV